MFLAAADQTLLATASPVIAREFGQLHDTSWLATIYLLTNAVMIPVYGRLGDRYGRREVLIVALGVFLLGSLLCAIAPGMAWLIGGRGLQGLGGGGLMTLTQAMIGDLVPPRQRVRFQGYFAIVFTAANVLGPMIGGYTVAHVSWRWLFAAQIPLVVLAGWRLSQLPPGRAHAEAPGISDVRGLLIFIVGTSLLLFGLTSAGHRFAWLSVWAAIVFGVGAALWTMLLIHEHKHNTPFFPIELLRIRVIKFSVITVLANSACRMAIIFYLPIYLQIGIQLDAGRAGLLLVPVMLGMLAGQQLSTRIGIRTGLLSSMPAFGMGIASIGFFGLAVAPARETIVIVLGSLAGLGLGPAMSCSQLIVQSVAGRERLGAVTALMMLCRTGGAAFGTAITGAIIYGLLPTVDIRHLLDFADTQMRLQVLHAFHVEFVVAAFIVGLAAINAMRGPKIKF